MSALDTYQVYKGFNIGSAKPTLEEQQIIKYHLIDIRNSSDAMRYIADLKLDKCLILLNLVLGATLA